MINNCVSSGVESTPRDCGDLPDPANGRVSITGGTLSGAEVIYVCNPGFRLIGQLGRTCGNDGVWTGSSPRCECELETQRSQRPQRPLNFISTLGVGVGLVGG